MVPGAGLGARGAWCRLQNVGCRVQGVEFRAHGVGFRVDSVGSVPPVHGRASGLGVHGRVLSGGWRTGRPVAFASCSYQVLIMQFSHCSSATESSVTALHQRLKTHFGEEQ